MTSHSARKHQDTSEYRSSVALSSYQPPSVLRGHLGAIADLLPRAEVVPGVRKREVFLGWVPTEGRIDAPDVLYFETSYLGFDTDGSRASWSKTKADSDHRNDISIRHGADANTLPYFVLPKYPNTDKNWVGKDQGIFVGAVGVILGIDAKTALPKVVCAQFADAGPHNELGEASIATHRAFGRDNLVDAQGKPLRSVKDQDLNTGVDFITIVFPNTGAFRPLTPAQLEAIARPLFTKLGGLL
jgi:hypothetical protein